MGAIRDQISKELMTAMKEKKEETLISTLRMIKTAIVTQETSRSGEIDEKGFLKLLKSMKKQREESIEQYQKVGRDNLAEKEQAELKIIEGYLPQPLSDEDMEKIVEETIAEMGVTDIKQMGQVMKAAMAKTQGRGDGKKISAIVKAKLSQ